MKIKYKKYSIHQKGKREEVDDDDGDDKGKNMTCIIIVIVANVNVNVLFSLSTMLLFSLLVEFDHVINT